MVGGAAWLQRAAVTLPTKLTWSDFGARFTANMCNFDRCHGHGAHMESISVVPDNWCELLPALLFFFFYSKRSRP